MFDDLKPKRPRRVVDRQALMLWGLVALVALPGAYLYWRHRNQEAARATLQTLNDALTAYHERFDGYPDKLERLRGSESDRPPETAPPERARLLPTWQAKDRLVTGGYTYSYRATKRVRRWAATVPLSVEYLLTAQPSNIAMGGRFFSVDSSGEMLEGGSLEDLREQAAAKAQEKPQIEITATPVDEDSKSDDDDKDEN